MPLSALRSLLWLSAYSNCTEGGVVYKPDSPERNRFAWVDRSHASPAMSWSCPYVCYRSKLAAIGCIADINRVLLPWSCGAAPGQERSLRPRRSKGDFVNETQQFRRDGPTQLCSLNGTLQSCTGDGRPLTPRAPIHLPEFVETMNASIVVGQMRSSIK